MKSNFLASGLLTAAFVLNCIFINAQSVSDSIHVTTAGTLSSFISTNAKYEITDLKLTGTLNGTDFKFIRQMTELSTLDLSGASIVTGGDLTCYENTIMSGLLSDLLNLTKVVLPENLTSIGGAAFRACKRLSSVTIGNQVKVIDRGAFKECSALTHIDIPFGVEILGTLSVSTGSGVFEGCTKLKSISLPESLTFIDDGTFYDCTSLESVVFPDHLTSIEHYMFYNCTSLSSFTIPLKNLFLNLS